MKTTSIQSLESPSWRIGPGTLWFLLAVLGAGAFFSDGLDALLRVWQLPEYSHGPLIPVISGLLFLRHLKQVPAYPGEISDRWVGVGVVALALACALLGKLAKISDIVAYGVIIWLYGILLISFGWKTGRQFWPPVLHLVYMLPLPDTFYYKMATWLQLVSSELGVWFLKLLAVPVFLEGNIIDLGVYKLHVAEACSGLRYLFPILSFSYIFAVLYRGPMWHKAVLLISAAPITLLMNSVRIGVAGWIVNRYGVDWVEGFTHFFEGWVIFLTCIVIFFALARIMLVFHPSRTTLAEALDLEIDGLAAQAMRIRLIRPSPALITAALLGVAAAAVWEASPDREHLIPPRDSFALFPRQIGDWHQRGPAEVLEPDIARVLRADDYRSVVLMSPDRAALVGLFLAWYSDQTEGGVHSPEVCLPSGGWEIARLERSDIAKKIGSESPFEVNFAIIQKGEARMMVVYWFQRGKRRLASDISAKFWLLMDGLTRGRTDGALVRLTVPVVGTDFSAAEGQLLDVLNSLHEHLPRFVPE